MPIYKRSIFVPGLQTVASLPYPSDLQEQFQATVFPGGRLTAG